MRRSALDTLLSPLAPDLFLERCWGQRPQIFRGEARRFDALGFSSDTLRDAIGRADGLRDLRLAWADASGRPFMKHIPPQLWELYRAKATLSVHDLGPCFPALAAFAGEIKAALCLAGEARFNCNLSADGAGATLHMDSDAVFILQVEGHKRWEIGRTPAVPSLPRSFVLGAEGADLCDFQRQHPGVEVPLPGPGDLAELTLGPGDALYMPPGTWHRAAAVGHSLALTLLLTPVTLRRLLEGARGPLLGEERALRRSLPLAPAPGDAAARDATFSAQRAALDARLAALSPRALHAAWRERVVRGAASSWDEVVGLELRPDAVLRRAGPVPLCLAPDLQDPGVVWIQGAGRMLALPASAEPFARRLVHSPRFTAAEALSWADEQGRTFPWEAVAEVLGALVEAGLLQAQPACSALPLARPASASEGAHVA